MPGLADYFRCVAASTSLGMTAYDGLMTFTKNIGMLLLAIFLIIYGLIAVLGFNLGVVAGIIAILAGIFILLGR
jgi:hypothetical protein